MATTAVHSKAGFCCYRFIFVVTTVLREFFVWSLFCCAVLSVVSSIAIISLGKRGLVAFLLLPFDDIQLLVFCVII